MKFSAVSICFDEIEKLSSRLAITKKLADLFSSATPQEAAHIAYMSLGNLNPVYVGTQFNIAQKNMINIVAKLLDTSQENVTKKTKARGDIGLVAHDYSPKKPAALSVDEVVEELKAIHDIAGTGSQAQRESKILSLLKKLDNLSIKYVTRIIVGKLRLGFSDMTLIDAFSWMEKGDKSLRKDLEYAYNVSADIGHIIKTLKEGSIDTIKKIDVTCGIPIRPAGAERLATAQAIVKKIGSCVAEPKIDGFRLQVHVCKKGKGQSIHFYSRNLQDMSDMFPDLTKAVKDLKVSSLVAEGEAIAYDQATDTFLPFQETVRRKRKHEIEKVAQEMPLRLYLFNLLYHNGTSLLDKGQHDRRSLLIKMCKTQSKQSQKTILPIEQVSIKNASDLENYFNEQISQGLEGVVVKKPDAPYAAGARNFNWIKLKRQETGSLSDTIDCVILGYYSGSGKRAGFGIGAFLVGVRNEKNDSFETIAKIGTGLTDAKWKELKKRCDDIKVATKPKNVVCAQELTPDVWTTPDIVCSIRADEITRSPLHSTGKTDGEGFALRFPRIMAYRDDKSASEATTVKEIKQLYKIQFKSTKKKIKKDSGPSGQLSFL